MQLPFCFFQAVSVMYIDFQIVSLLFVSCGQCLSSSWVKSTRIYLEQGPSLSTGNPAIPDCGR